MDKIECFTISQLVANQAFKNKSYLARLAQDRLEPQMIPPIVILEADTRLVYQ